MEQGMEEGMQDQSDALLWRASSCLETHVKEQGKDQGTHNTQLKAHNTQLKAHNTQRKAHF